MSPVVIDLRKADDQRDVVHRAAQALAEGRLVAFPTDTVYVLAASALDEAAVLRLAAAKQGTTLDPTTFSLVIKSCDELLDYAPDAPAVALRLARRCWPGPVTLLLSDRNEDGALRQLPTMVRKLVAPQGEVGLHIPGHAAVVSVLRYLAGPLVLTAAHRQGAPVAITAEQVAENFGHALAMILDDGPAKFAQPATVVRPTEQGLQTVQAGAVSEESLLRLASVLVLMVCTGNTCRSPMAEVLLKARLAERYGCTPEELEAKGILVMSAGVSANSGDRAAPAAVATMAERGLDLSPHESRPITDRLVRFADVILTMTRGHRQLLVDHWPEAAGRAFLLCGENDLADPIGGPPEVYHQCAKHIDEALDDWVPRLPFP